MKMIVTMLNRILANAKANVKANAKAVSAQKSAHREGGFTAMELFVVIIVGLAIFIAAASQIGKLFGGSSSLEENRNLQELVVGAKKFRTPTGYPADPIKALAAADLLPKSMSYDGSKLTSSWGGAVKMAGAGDLTVTYEGVSKANCAATFTKVGSMGLFKSISVAGKALELPKDSANIVTTCGEMKADGAVVLVTNK